MLFSNSTVIVTYRRTSQSEFQKDEDEERDNYLKYGLKEKFLKEKKKDLNRVNWDFFQFILSNENRLEYYLR